MASNTENVSIWWRHHDAGGKWFTHGTKDCKENQVLSLTGVRVTNTKRLLTISFQQNAWLWLADALGLSNHDQPFCWKFLVKNLLVFATLTPETHIQDTSLHLGPLLPAWFNFIPACISNYTHYELWDEITYPFPNINGATIEVWEWINNFIPYFIMGVITYPCCLFHTKYKSISRNNAG